MSSLLLFEKIYFEQWLVLIWDMLQSTLVSGENIGLKIRRQSTFH